MPNCRFCNDDSKIDLPDYMKLCDECYEKGVKADMDFDKPNEYFLCRECDVVYHIDELGFEDDLISCKVCKYCVQEEVKNGTHG